MQSGPHGFNRAAAQVCDFLVAQSADFLQQEHFAVGLGQLVAAGFPGTSRSAATIMFAMVLGLARPIATEFSFLVGVPTLLAAGGLETLQALRHPSTGPPTDWAMLALGTVVSAVTAFLVVRWLLRWVQTHSFSPFGWYRVVLGLLMLARFV